MHAIPISDVVDTLNYGRSGTVREAQDDEEPDFVQRHDKECTGMFGRNRLGIAFSFELDPPVMLRAGTGYVIELLE
jgi:hypothetical protein